MLIPIGEKYQSPIWGMVGDKCIDPLLMTRWYQSPIWGMVEQHFVFVDYSTTTSDMCQPQNILKTHIYDAN